MTLLVPSFNIHQPPLLTPSILTKVCKIEEKLDNLNTIIEKYFTEFTILIEVVKELRSDR